MVFRYTYRKNNKVIEVQHSLQTIEVGYIIRRYLKEGFEIIKREFNTSEVDQDEELIFREVK